jgi:hypothetical protein
MVLLGLVQLLSTKYGGPTTPYSAKLLGGHFANQYSAINNYIEGSAVSNILPIITLLESDLNLNWNII